MRCDSKKNGLKTSHRQLSKTLNSTSGKYKLQCSGSAAVNSWNTINQDFT